MSAPASHAGRIGPNAITRVAEVLPPRVGEAGTRSLFERAGLLHHLLSPPQGMVEEAEVRRLHDALREELGTETAQQVALAAGQRTAEYLLAHRIPRAVQALLKRLPAPLAARVLLSAIRRNAWTFVGSGGIETEGGRRIRITRCVLCQDPRVTSGGVYYAAVFERLFQELVDASACVREVACIRSGAPRCVFEIGR